MGPAIPSPSKGDSPTARPGPRFFSETWRNPKTYDANTLPLTSVTPEVVTTPDLVLNVYDPNAKYIPEYRKTLRFGSWAEDWGGPTCLMIHLNSGNHTLASCRYSVTSSCSSTARVGLSSQLNVSPAHSNAARAVASQKP